TRGGRASPRAGTHAYAAARGAARPPGEDQQAQVRALAAATSSSRRTGVVMGASWKPLPPAWVFSAVSIMASQKPSSVSLDSVSVGSIMMLSFTVVGKYTVGAW